MRRMLLVLFLTCVNCLMFTMLVSAGGISKNAEEGDLANSWRYENGDIKSDLSALSVLGEASHPDATLKGIDVSRHQGIIDWEKVKKAGIEFAMIRCGYGQDIEAQDDPYFARNVSECERLGIPYGVYLYSYATDTGKAASEAEHVLRLLEGCNLSYPVYYDMEDDSTIGSDLAAIATVFCNKISEAGYPVGVYANLSWWNSYLTDACFDNWYRWVAQWNSSCSYEGEYAIWQYSSSGTVPGISGNVDMNYLIGTPEDHGTTITINENVVRIFGKGRCETAIAVANYVKDKMGLEKFDYIVMASGDNFADALAGSYLAERRNAPILLYRSSAAQLNRDYIRANLKEGGVVYLLGGTAAIPEKEEAALQMEGIRVKRLAGGTRFETNIEILKEAGVSNEEILVCTGYEFADSLSASAVGKPILLVHNESGKLSEAQTAYLSTLSANKFFVIGGVNAVGESLVEKLREFGEVERIGGATRYETSILVAEKFFDTPNNAVLAYAYNFPDGLCGGPLAAKIEAPLILTKTNAQALAKEYIHGKSITSGVILGGEVLIDNHTVKDIFGAGRIRELK